MEKDPKELAEQMLKAHKGKRGFSFTARISTIRKAFEILRAKGELKLKEEKAK